MIDYIFGVVLYLIIGYILSLIIGFRIKAGDGKHILTSMAIWPIVLLFMTAWIIEDVFTYLQKKR